VDGPGRELRTEYRRVASTLVGDQGWRYKYEGKHPTLYPADKSFSPIVFATTPSDHRAFKNFVARIRRAGGIIS
jgi:hypothetical protein